MRLGIRAPGPQTVKAAQSPNTALGKPQDAGGRQLSSFAMISIGEQAEV